MVLWHPFRYRISAEMIRDVDVCWVLKEKGAEVEWGNDGLPAISSSSLSRQPPS